MRRPVAAVFAGMLVVAVFPAAAPTARAQVQTSAFETSSVTAHGAFVRDAIRDVPDARGDIVSSSVRYGTRSLNFRMELRNAGSFKTAPWQYGDTMLGWWLETTGDSREDYAVVVFNDGRDRLLARTVNAHDATTTLCWGRLRKDGDVVRVRIPHRCISSPYKARMSSLIWYDPDVEREAYDTANTDYAPPKRQQWTGTFRRPPQPTRVIWPSLPSTSTVYGEQNYFIARLRSAQPSGRRLTLHRRFKGSQRWVKVDAASTLYGGSADFTATMRRPAYWQVRSAGNRLWQPSRSKPVLVNVGVAVSTDYVESPMPLRGNLNVGGRVWPAKSGTRVWLQRKTTRGWVNDGAAYTTAEGAYTIRTRPRRSGRILYRVKSAGDGVRTGRAAQSFVVDVYTAKIGGVHPSDTVAETTNLNSEWVTVVNNGRLPVDLQGWWVGNINIGATVPYSQYSLLRPGEGVRIHTGDGTARSGHLYLGVEIPLWPPTGRARMYDTDDVLMHERDYGSATG